METGEHKKINLNFGRMSDKTVSAMAAQTLNPEAAPETATSPSSSADPDEKSLSSAFNRAAKQQTDNEKLQELIRRTTQDLKDAYAINAEIASTAMGAGVPATVNAPELPPTAIDTTPAAEPPSLWRRMKGYVFSKVAL